MALYKKYCDQENQILIDNYEPGVYGTTEHCKLLLEKAGYYRTRKGIKRQYARLCHPQPTQYRPIATPHKRNMVIKYAGRMRLEQIAIKVGLSKETVKRIARAEGLSLDWHYEYFTMNELSRIFDTSQNWIRFRLENGIIESLNHRQSKQHYQVTRQQLKKYLCKYPTDLDDIIKAGSKPDMVLLVDIMAGIQA